jgi:hypothetical protein
MVGKSIDAAFAEDADLAEAVLLADDGVGVGSEENICAGFAERTA